MSKPKKYNQNSAIRSALRRTFSRSPVVQEVRKTVRREVPKFNKDGSLAKKPKVEYQCAQCEEWFPGTEIEVDHIEAVIDPNQGFTGWKDFIDRLFCDKNNLRCMCKSCHKKVTDEQRKLRSEAKSNSAS